MSPQTTNSIRETTPSAGRRLPLFALFVALLCLAVAALAIVRIPISWLWLPTLVASSWGHFLCVVTLLLMALALRQRSLRSSRVGRTSFACGIAAAALAATPGTQELSASRDLPYRLERAFGKVAPRTAPGHEARPTPVRMLDLFGIRSAEVTVRTLDYGATNGTPLRLDLYRRDDTPGPQPVVVMVHGGAWVSGQRSDFPDLNRYLAARGYAVAAIDYRLAPGHRFPAPIEDVHRAIAHLKDRSSELGLDADRFAIIGRSAGGQIALTAAYSTHDATIRGVIGLYAPTDMIWSWDLSLDTTYLDGREVIAAFLGGPPRAYPEDYRRASPLFLARTGSPPTLLIHGARDELVSPHQSTRLAHRLDELGVPHLHIELPSATHAFDVAFASPAGQVSTYAIERFLASVF